MAYLHFGEAWLPAGWTVATAAIAILGSALAAALGLAGLARRDLPERRWLVLTVLAVALITLAGYGGSFGAPFHERGPGLAERAARPFRNIYKFQTGARARARPRADAPGGVGRASARGARPVRGRRYAPLIAARPASCPGWPGRISTGRSCSRAPSRSCPSHWTGTADWLEKYSPDTRALVVPATAHGIYTWGSPIDQPLDVLADSRWAQRDFVPFGTARQPARDGRGRAGAADAAAKSRACATT